MKDPNCDFCNHVQGVCVECSAPASVNIANAIHALTVSRAMLSAFSARRMLEHPGILLEEYDGPEL